MACRDEIKAKAGIDNIKALNDGASLEFIKLDLASLQSVRDFVISFSKLPFLLSIKYVLWVLCKSKRTENCVIFFAPKISLLLQFSVMRIDWFLFWGQPKLDILINNAGVMCHPLERTTDGFELHFQVNYLGMCMCVFCVICYSIVSVCDPVLILFLLNI